MAVHFELISPEKLLLSRDVEMAILPGIEGDMGILQDHMPVISILRPGVVTLMENGKVAERIFVEGGFVEVTRESCVVLAEHARKVSEIEAGDAERALMESRADLADAKNDLDRNRSERRLQIAEARMEALNASIY